MQVSKAVISAAVLGENIFSIRHSMKPCTPGGGKRQITQSFLQRQRLESADIMVLK